MRILVVSSRLSDTRRDALTRLLSPEGEPVFLDFADLEGADGDAPPAIVLDGRLPAPSHVGIKGTRH
jgi:hypothetical protein